MKKIILSAALAALCTLICASEPVTVRLYPEGPAESNGLEGTERVDGNGHISGVSEPEMTVWLPAPERSTGQAVVVFPGGGYRFVSWNNEGVHTARWLTERGIAAAVVKYRLPNGHSGIPLADARRALEIVRSNASEWGIDPSNVGVMGFSAGGHLASTVLTHFTSPAERPDFGVLVYPVITMDEELTHAGSRRHLLGSDPDSDMECKFSNHTRVTPDTPPVFIVFSDDDKTVDPRNGTMFYDALRANGVAAEFHVYPTGGHGWGFDPDNRKFGQRGEFHTALDRWLWDISRRSKAKTDTVVCVGSGTIPADDGDRIAR